MPNANYLKGRKKEQALVRKLKSESYIALRSAGSKSPIDVVAVHPEKKLILLIQCKPKDFPISQIKKLEEENKKLNGVYFVKFTVET